jgi:small subunit ribosomal protein S25e
MGGKKKIGLKQMERQQSRQDESEKAKEKKKEKTGSPKEKKTVGVIAPDVKSEKIVAEIKKMNVLTPYAVASRFNIRISAAKDFLRQLEEEGAVQLASGSHNIKIYKPAAS